MKANGAPEKLYLLPNGLISYCRNTDEDVEYISTDVFIEKAKKWFEENFMNGHKWEISTYEFENTQSMIDEFRKYMKGE